MLFHNSTSVTDPSTVIVTTQTNITVSKPYNETEVDVIVPYMSNTTDVVLETEVWSGRYATLVIEGNQSSNATNSTGATVAEWAIVGDRGQILRVG